MPDLTLAKLPGRKPVEFAILMTPDPHRRLQDYARLYAETEKKETVTDLIPAMPTSFLDSDRGGGVRGRGASR